MKPSHCQGLAAQGGRVSSWGGVGCSVPQDSKFCLCQACCWEEMLDVLVWRLLWEAKGCPVTPCLSPAHKSNLSLWHFPSPKHLFGQTNSVLPPSLNSSDQVLPWGYKGEQVRHLLKLKCWSRHCLAVILPALIPASLINSEHFCVYTESQSAVIAEGHLVSAIAFRVQLQNQLVLGCWSSNSSNGQSGLILTHSPCTFNKLHVSYYLPAADNSFLPHLSERAL